MNFMHPPILFLALTLVAAHSVAATPPKSDTPADYAYALPLQISGKQGVLALRLPQDVYLRARTAGLDDLRVFDDKGIAQPYALYRPSPERQVKRDLLAANIFPVRSALRMAAGDPAIDVDIQTRPDGSVKSVRAHTGKGQAGDATALVSLILDFGVAAKGSDDRPARIEALRFTAPKNRDNYSAEVWLETSDDLKRWQTVGAADLRWLSNDSAQTLANDRLEFTARAFRYARVTWRRGEPTAFPAIDAELVTPQDSEPLRETLWVKPRPGKQAGDLVYPAGIAVPVEQVSLRLSEANIVYPMAIGYYVERPSRNLSQSSEWIFQPQARATFYQISQDGETRRSGALTIGPAHHAEWVIRPQNVAATAQPDLGLAWQPATLVFLAGGTPPYALSFGRGDATPASQPLAQVAPGFTARELNQLEQAQAGELQAGGAAAGERTTTGLSARHRTFILWGVLLLGLIILGTMAWRLIRQMKAGAERAD